MGELLHYREAIFSSRLPRLDTGSLSRAAFGCPNNTSFWRIRDFSIIGTSNIRQSLDRFSWREANCQHLCNGTALRPSINRRRRLSARSHGRFSRLGAYEAVDATGRRMEVELGDIFKIAKFNEQDTLKFSAVFSRTLSTFGCRGGKDFSRHFSKFEIHCYGQRVHSHSIDSLNSSLRLGRSSVISRSMHNRVPKFYMRKNSYIVLTKAKPWWKEFLFQQEGDGDVSFGIDDEQDDNLEGLEDFDEDEEFTPNINGGSEEIDPDEVDRLLSDDRKFFSWKQKRESIDELREFQQTERDPDSRDWEDWLDESFIDSKQTFVGKDGGWYEPQSEWEKEGVPRDAPKKPERGMNRTIKELLLRIFENQEEVEEDLNFEEKVFRFTSQSTAKFVTILILVPWAVDFLVHDFVMVPFLRRWVEEVPLAAKVLDLKESQKLHMIETLKLERQRVRFEAEIGKAPPLSDEELNEHIREEALELREEIREENRQAFGNLWSDALAGFTVFLLLIFNPEQVSIMRMTGDRLFTNISDTGKAFIIILGTDIFLGYHSETGWETVIEMLLDHYGLEASQASVYIFVAIVPVTIDACFKLWVFRYLTRLSPSAAATFREMKRH